MKHDQHHRAFALTLAHGKATVCRVPGLRCVFGHWHTAKKTLGEEFFAESQPTGSRRRNSSPRVFSLLSVKKF
jgi:hypothetical protein